MSDVKQYHDLIKKVNYFSKRYYQDDVSEISDQEYDALYAELLQLENMHPDWLSANSPTQRVGYATAQFNPSNHDKPMLSLANIYTAEEIGRFIRSTTTDMYCIEPKIDGQAVTLLYKDGKLKAASTRGNGHVGTNITHVVKYIPSLPIEIDNTEEFEIRGELYISAATFNKINRECMQKGIPVFANQRNLASGTTKLHDEHEIRSRGLSIILYDIVTGNTSSHFDDIQLLHDLGFPVVSPVTIQVAVGDKTCYDKINEICNDIIAKASEYDYPIDGSVIKVDNIELQSILGANVKTPRFAIAYKKMTEGVATTVTKIEYQVGVSGCITPVVWFTPVDVDGSTITKCSLYNVAKLTEMDININDRIIVGKGGEVIPKVIKVLDKRSDKIIIPTICPSCGTPLESSDRQTYCTNTECSERLFRTLVKFVSKDAMDIHGFGMNTLKKLFDANLVKYPVDIYHLDINAFKSIDEKSALMQNKMFTEIRKSLNKSIGTVLYAYSAFGKSYINRWDTEMSKLTIDDICNMTIDQVIDFIKIESMANTMYTRIHRQDFHDLLIRMKALKILK
jgi:DNA ligase (NAD+)